MFTNGMVQHAYQNLLTYTWPGNRNPLYDISPAVNCKNERGIVFLGPVGLASVKETQLKQRVKICGQQLTKRHQY